MRFGNKGQAKAFSVHHIERILGCSSKTCNEAVGGHMGSETLKNQLSKMVVQASNNA